MYKIMFNLRSVPKLARDPFYVNSLSIIANSFLGTFYGLVFWIVAAHIVPANEIGLAIATISAATFLTSLSRFGMDDVLVRFLPGSGNRSALYGSILVVTLALALLFTGLFLCLVDVLSPSLGYLKSGWYLVLFVVYMVTVSVYTTQNTTLLAVRRADRSVVQNSLLGARVPLMLLIGSLGAVGILLSFNLAYLAAMSLGLFYLVKQGFELKVPGLKTIAMTVRGHGGYSAGNYLSVIFTMMPSTLLPIVIMNTMGPEDVAYFYIAYSIAAMLFIIPNAVAMSLFIEGSHDMPLDRYAGKAFRLLIAIVVPLIIVLFLFGDKLLLLFNREYSYQSVELLRLLVISGLFSPVIAVYSSVRRVEKKVKSLNMVSATTAVLLVGAGYVFLSVYGLAGLGYAWILANAAVAIVLTAILIKEGIIFRSLRRR
jgi:O-antigen/teichoic acid export membrane protein